MGSGAAFGAEETMLRAKLHVYNFIGSTHSGQQREAQIFVVGKLWNLILILLQPKGNDLETALQD